MKTTACIVALALVALCPSAARADTLIFVEDFSDASGEPAFDPLFNHSCVVDDPEGSHWALGTDLRLWLVAGFANTVTFNLEPDWSVIGASVESFTHGLSCSARFIGATGTAEFAPETWPFDPPLLWAVSADDIGEITAIELRSGQGSFDNVTIQVRVVPEPAAGVLLTTGLFIAFVGLTRRRLM
jgi:hypothetical protein